MSPKKAITILLFITVMGIAGCASKTDEATFQTQVAIAVQQTKIAEDITFLTQAVSSPEDRKTDLHTVTSTPADTVTNRPNPTKALDQILEETTPTVSITPRPTLTPRPLRPMLRADDDYFCRQRPEKYSEAHWMFTQGDNAPILGKSKNGWWLISVSDPDTRTECCWVGGGVASGSLASIPVIRYEIDRLNCP